MPKPFLVAIYTFCIIYPTAALLAFIKLDSQKTKYSEFFQLPTSYYPFLLPFKVVRRLNPLLWRRIKVRTRIRMKLTLLKRLKTTPTSMDPFNQGSVCPLQVTAKHQGWVIHCHLATCSQVSLQQIHSLLRRTTHRARTYRARTHRGRTHRAPTHKGPTHKGPTHKGLTHRAFLGTPLVRSNNRNEFYHCK